MDSQLVVHISEHLGIPATPQRIAEMNNDDLASKFVATKLAPGLSVLAPEVQ